MSKRSSALGDISIEKWRDWQEKVEKEDLIALEYRGSLKRRGLADAIDVAVSVFTQNPTIREELEEFENKLRKEGILPEPTEATKAAQAGPKHYDQGRKQRQYDASRLQKLEQEVIELRAKLRRYEELSEAISELGGLGFKL